MEKLPWFKFSPSDWMMGKIQYCSEITKCKFIYLCCVYWNNETELSCEDAEVIMDKEHYDTLVSKRIIKVIDGMVEISFLKNQYHGNQDVAEKRRQAAIARWEQSKSKANEMQVHASALQDNKDAVQSDAEKRREEERREIDIVAPVAPPRPNKPKKAFIAPRKENVINYFVENGYTATAGEKAFEYYNIADWHDASGKKIKNWKQKMQGVWFKPENKSPIRLDTSTNPTNDPLVDHVNQYLQKIAQQ